MITLELPGDILSISVLPDILNLKNKKIKVSNLLLKAIEKLKRFKENQNHLLITFLLNNKHSKISKKTINFYQ